MSGWKLRWWKNAEEIRNDILNELRVERAKEKEAEDKIKKEADDKIKAENAVKAKEPWVDIKGILEDPKNGIRVDLDWNDAFVTYLRDNGITGVDDEIVVQKWITMLYRDLIEQNQEAQTQGINNDLL